MTEKELFSIKIPEPDRDIYEKAKDRFDRLAKPLDGLGTFEDDICRIASIQGRVIPDISKKGLVIMCSDSRVVSEGVSQTDAGVTARVARLMSEGRSTVCAMAKDYPVDIIPVDIGIDTPGCIPGLLDKKAAGPSGDIMKEPAMSTAECLRAIVAGIEVADRCRDKGIGIIATGEMGIGNTTTSTALLCALTGLDPDEVTGRGAGLSDEGLKRKTHVIKRALELHGLNNAPENIVRTYALSALSKVGGFDLAGLAGVYIGGAINRTPVIIDGLISAVAALAAEYICPGVKGSVLASHTGREKGTATVTDILGLRSVIDADMALGEGTGALMLFPLLDMVMSLYESGTMFEDASIERYERFGR